MQNTDLVNTSRFSKEEKRLLPPLARGKQRKIIYAVVFCLVLYSVISAFMENVSAKNAEEFLSLCESGTLAEIRTAIRRGADVNAAGGRFAITPLMAAGRRKGSDLSNLKIVELLLDAGADVNIKSEVGRTALIDAASSQTPEVISALLKAGAKVNEQSARHDTALMYAAMYNNNPEVVVLLLDAGADATMKNKVGDRAVDLAARGHHKKLPGTEAYKMLLEASQ